MTQTIQTLTQTLQQNLTVTDMFWQTKLQSLDLQSPNTSLVFTEGNQALGWLSLWWDNTPKYQNKNTACIGHYYASSSSVASKLLTHAQVILTEKNIEYIIGPMDGNTWHSYRLTSQYFDHPEFFLDLLTPLSWLADFSKAGFENIAEYYSSITKYLNEAEAAQHFWQVRFDENKAYKLRPLNMQQIDRQLKELHELSLKGFQNNLFYTDIAYNEFEQLYHPILPYIIPELVQMVYFENRLIGFAFCIPDYAQKARGEIVDTLILKTLVRDPDPQFRQLGEYLTWNTHRLAKQYGYKKLILAFMHEDNPSLALSEKTGCRLIRSYSLYGKQL